MRVCPQLPGCLHQMLFRVSVFSGLPVNATGDRRGLAPDRLVAAYVLLIVVAGLGRLWWATEAWLLLVGLATAAALVAVATRRIPFKDPLTCLLLAASALVFTAADAIFSAQKLPPVHPVDVVFVPAYALAVVALYRLNRLADREAGYLDTAVLAAGLTVLLVAALDKGAPSAGADSLVLLYPLAGLVVLTLSVRLMMCYRTPASWLMLAAAVWLLAGGFVPALFGYPVSALLLETLHMGTMACWGLAALWRPMPALPGAVDAVDRRPPVWLFALVVLLPPVALLIRAGMRLTRQRVILSELLFANGDRHVTAEALHAEALAADAQISLATVYNTLNQFTQAGLLRRIGPDGSRSFFDTNTSPHPHYYLQGEDILLDVPEADLAVANMPQPLPGHEVSRLDVIIHLRRKRS